MSSMQCQETVTSTHAGMYILVTNKPNIQKAALPNEALQTFA